MRAKIMNYETKELINDVEVFSKKEELVFKEIEKMQETEDVLKLGFTCRIEPSTQLGLGISCFYRGEGYATTIEAPKGCSSRQDSTYSFVMGGIRELEKPPTPLSLSYKKDDVVIDTGLKLSIIIYLEGIVIAVGKRTFGMFGGASNLYLDKITTKSFKSNGKSNCRKFKNPKEAMNFIEKNAATFQYMVDTYGYQFNVEYCTKEYEENVLLLPEKNKKTFCEDFEKLKSYLSNLNKDKTEVVEEETDSDLELEEDSIITEKEQKEEALKRMRSLDLYHPVIDNFKKGILMLSEGSGILFDISEKEVLEQINEMKENGLLPYHVIHSNTTFGNLYDILYVSNSKMDWKKETYDRKNEIICSYCFNQSNPEFSEDGDISIIPINGGLKRV